MATVEVAIKDLQRMCESALVAVGLGKDDASVVAEDYIENEAAGRVSHGLAGFDIAVGNARTRGRNEVLVDSPSTLVIEGHGDMGHLVCRHYLPQIVEKAKTSGVAVLAVRDVSRIASPAVIARRLAEQDLASITIEYGGQAFVAHPDYSDPVVSTNPLSIGFPYRGGPHPILDMATSERAYFFVKLAETLGQAIPPTWARDVEGSPVSDAALAHSLSPLGGYKGFGLAFMFEVLSAAMLGVPAGLKGNLGVRGILTIVLSPGAFGSSRAAIETAVAGIVSDLGGAPYPGFSSGQRLAAARVRGTLDVEEGTVEKLRRISGEI